MDRRLKSQSIQITNVYKLLQDIYTDLKEKNPALADNMTYNKFLNIHSIEIPMKNLNDFENFESTLLLDEKLYKDLVRKIYISYIFFKYLVSINLMYLIFISVLESIIH